MGKLEDRENRRRASVVGPVLPSLYEDIQKIAYVQRRSTSDLVATLLEQYRGEHGQELDEYVCLKKSLIGYDGIESKD